MTDREVSSLFGFINIYIKHLFFSDIVKHWWRKENVSIQIFWTKLKPWGLESIFVNVNYDLCMYVSAFIRVVWVCLWQ